MFLRILQCLAAESIVFAAWLEVKLQTGFFVRCHDRHRKIGTHKGNVVMAEDCGRADWGHGAQAGAHAARHCKLILVVLVRCSDALAREDIVETLRCMVTRVQSGTGDVIALSSPLLHQLLCLLSIGVSLEVAEAFRDSSLAFMRLPSAFGRARRWQTGTTGTRREDPGAGRAVEVERGALAVRIDGSGRLVVFDPGCFSSFITLLFLSLQQVLEIWDTFEEDLGVVARQPCIGD